MDQNKHENHQTRQYGADWVIFQWDLGLQRLDIYGSEWSAEFVHWKFFLIILWP